MKKFLVRDIACEGLPETGCRTLRDEPRVLRVGSRSQFLVIDAGCLGCL